MRWGIKLAAALVAALGCLSIPALAEAAPANDDFAARELLGGPLPIEVQRSNVGATKESGEFLPGLAPAGHSIWFEWEATSTGWVTIGACDDQFPTILGVFTGTEVDKLTAVAAGNADEGPGCLYGQRQYTFKAKSGSKYEIAVDGNVFHLPEAPTPTTEGDVLLRIESTPLPANDDFADATPLTGRIEEEPGGDRFYLAGTLGYNWTATEESGEPAFGVSSGASVWYSWTAPETGSYRFGGPCCGTGLHWAIYSGASLAALTPVLLGAESGEMSVVAGTTYRIVIYGDPDPVTEEPAMASFSFLITARLAALPVASLPAPQGPSALPQPDVVAPRTMVAKRVLKRRPPIVAVSFGSNEEASTFRCSLDGKPFRVCASPWTFSRPGPDRHVLRVYAVDASGNADPSPAVTRFRISPPHRQRS